MKQKCRLRVLKCNVCPFTVSVSTKRLCYISSASYTNSLLVLKSQRLLATSKDFTENKEFVITSEVTLIVTIRNSSCGKVVFSQASVILSTVGRCAPPGQTPL